MSSDAEGFRYIGGEQWKDSAPLKIVSAYT